MIYLMAFWCIFFMMVLMLVSGIWRSGSAHGVLVNGSSYTGRDGNERGWFSIPCFYGVN